MFKYLFFLFIFLSSPKLLLAQKDVSYIKAGKLYDSKSNRILNNKLITIQGDKIIAIEGFKNLPEDAHVIDLSNYTVLPGLIDAHTHVLFSQEVTDDFAEHSITTLTMVSDALRVLRGSKRAKSYVEQGITSIKDLGNSGQYLDVALRDAINEGSVDGPRIYASGPILGAQGGQVYGVNQEHQSIIEQEYRIITSPEDAINAVREHLNQGVDLIKVCADNLPNKTTLTLAELKSIVTTAHAYNLTVTAHCVTNQSAWNAVEAGVDGIEHGFNIADSTLAKMAKKSIYLVPTENSSVYMNTYAELAGYAKDDRAWISYYLTNSKDRLRRAIDQGVTILAGSDNYTDINLSRGESSKDMFRYYFEAGMKPLDILQSSTYLSALQLNKTNKIGYLQPQAFADIIAVKGDILKDFVNSLDTPVFVMKGGEIFVDLTKSN